MTSLNDDDLLALSSQLTKQLALIRQERLIIHMRDDDVDLTIDTMLTKLPEPVRCRKFILTAQNPNEFSFLSIVTWQGRTRKNQIRAQGIVHYRRAGHLHVVNCYLDSFWDHAIIQLSNSANVSVHASEYVLIIEADEEITVNFTVDE